MPASITDYDSALAYLYARVDFERVPAPGFRYEELKLERMTRLLATLDQPQRSIATIHVAGTKGKGSTCGMLAAILQAQGLRTGLFTSPHLETFEERIRVDGEMIPRSTVVELVAELARAIERTAPTETHETPTFFEMTTALAWLWFRQAEVDVVVLETGLGGRLDATNVCNPLVTVITPISIDHTQQLGHTIAEIAAEKGGILKPGIPVICGARHPDARRVIESIAKERGVPCFTRDADFEPSLDERGELESLWRIRTHRHTYHRVPLRVLGRHQGENLALALAAFDEWRERTGRSTVVNFDEPLRNIALPGRQEIVRRQPLVIVDSCHNVASAESLAASLGESPLRERRKVLVFASSRDKDFASQLRILLPHFQHAIMTRYGNNPRGCPPEELLAIAGSLTASVESVDTSRSALQAALELCRDEDCLVIAGSFYLAGELRTELLTAQEKPRQVV